MNAELLEKLMKALYDRKGQAADPEEVMEVLNQIYPEHKFILVACSENNRQQPIRNSWAGVFR